MLSLFRMKFRQLREAAFVLLLYGHVSFCMIEHMPLPDGLTDCFTRYREKTTIVNTVGESIASFCFGQYMWHAARERGIQGFNISREASHDNICCTI